jgi:hypothetical protein
VTTEAAPATTGQEGAAPAAASPNGATSQPATPWFAGADYSDDDRASLVSKGWDKLPTAVPKPVLESYRNLESLLGNKANAVILPRPDDVEGRKALMSKLGKPEKAEEYKLPASITPDKAQNLNPALVKQFQTWADKADLTNDQFGALVEQHEAAVEAAEKAADQQWELEKTQTVEKLRVEFGDQYGEQIARGNLLITQGLMTKEQAADLATAMGHEAATRMMIKLGSSLAQHKTIGLNGNAPSDGFVTDKARALARINSIKSLGPKATGPDADFRSILNDPGHPEHNRVLNEWRTLQAAAFGGQKKSA